MPDEKHRKGMDINCCGCGSNSIVGFKKTANGGYEFLCRECFYKAVLKLKA